MRVLAVCGSLQRASGNLRLIERAVELAPAGMTLVRFDGVRDLPLFNPDDNEGAPPAAVAHWRHALREAEAVFIASPEYGHSLPGALKNAIDWVIGSGELHRKPVAVTASTRSEGRGQRGLDALCATLRALDARVLGGEPIVLGPDADESLIALLEALQGNA
jgi:chromate reductase